MGGHEQSTNNSREPEMDIRERDESSARSELLAAAEIDGLTPLPQGINLDSLAGRVEATPSGRPSMPWDGDDGLPPHEDLGTHDPASPELIRAARQLGMISPKTPNKHATPQPQVLTPEAKAAIEEARRKIQEATGISHAEQQAYEEHRRRDLKAGPVRPYKRPPRAG